MLEGKHRTADERLAELVAEVAGAVRGLDENLFGSLIEPGAGVEGRGLRVEGLFPSSDLGYEVIYTAVPAMGHEPTPPPMRSRISPPVPVLAPLKGSTVVGKL